ncbi:MAG: protein translocase subunit SecD [Alicyclobacillus sp.]|nr:protein translocase subunit SecD [Alicyclobacillus sp.]
MKWGRFGAFIVVVLCILGLTAGTSMSLWKTITLGLDLQGGFDLLYRIDPTPGNPVTKQGVEAALQAVQLRVNNLGVSSPQIQLEGGRNIRVELAGAFDQKTAENTIGETAQLAIYGNVIVYQNGKKIPFTADTLPYLLQEKGVTVKPDPKTLLMTGNDLKSDAHVGQNDQGWNVVDVTFKNATRWAKITQAYLGKPLYTFLNKNLVTYPTVQEMIPNGQTQISLGPDATVQQCNALANELNAGSLPYPLHLVSAENVGPSLGAASLRATMWAGLWAVILIFAFMIFLYRMAGLIANIALIAYAYLLLLVFSGMHIVLTLPGLAALVLGIGMAVDANIITYERIKDEMRNGRSLLSAVVAGNRRAMRTIIDSNATTFIAGAVMYWFGQGDIRGFAIALMLSIVISMLTAVLLSRAMLLLFARSNVVRRPWWYGIGKGVVQR